MRIAYILPSLINQGPIVVVKNIVDFLVDWGHEVDVFYLDEKPSIMEFKCPTHRITMSTPIDFDRYDVVHSHCLRPDIYVYRWRKRIHHAKMVSTLHQDTLYNLRDKYGPIMARIYTTYWCHIQSKFDGVITISNQLKEVYCKRIKAPITVIYNGCTITEEGAADAEITKVLTKAKSEYKLLGTYAFVVPCKGLSQVIQTLPLLQDYAFVVIGEGPDVDNLKILAQKLAVKERVFFFPYQKNPCNYLSFFDVYMMPSYSEGFGLSMVEAALAKKSIVCSDIPVFHEIFSEGEAQFFTLDDTNSLCQAILYAYENRRQLGEAAYNKATREFASIKMAENHLNYYNGLVQRPSRVGDK